jgi:transposase
LPTSAEEKICIVLARLRGDENLAALTWREGIAESLYYKWSKEFWKLEGVGCLATQNVRPHHLK